MITYLIVLALAIFADVAGRWAFLPARYLPRHRARTLRVRLRLRLHPGKGFATLFGLQLRWGRLAALRRSGRIRPSLPWPVRALFQGSTRCSWGGRTTGTGCGCRWKSTCW
jgi:hypothetical protein